MMADQRFRRTEHLRLRADFARVFARRCTSGDDLFVVHIADNGLRHSRLGVSVAKRIGNAVIRNRIRRRVREAFRRAKGDLPTGFDIVLVAKPHARESESNLDHSLRTLIPRAVRKARRS